MFKRLSRVNRGPLPAESLRAIYREVMSSALAIEKSMTIAYLGPEATFTHEAAIQRFGIQPSLRAQRTIAEVFSEVSRGRADYGVVPIENSTEGVVTHTLDMFVDSDLKIVAQIVRPIQQCLQARMPAGGSSASTSIPRRSPNAATGSVETCRTSELIETSSNARSAELAATDTSAAAIGGVAGGRRSTIQGAGKRHSGQRPQTPPVSWCWAGNVPRQRARTAPASCSAWWTRWAHCTARSKPFRRNRINMTKIESRPSKRKAWEYYFFVDVDGHIQDKKVARSVELLAEHCTFVKVLGSYPNAE